MRLRREKKILEWTQYLGYYYATPKAWLNETVESGMSVGMCLDHRGVVRVKKLFPGNSVSIFVKPPSINELKARMEKRCLETDPKEIQRRLLLAKKEIQRGQAYDVTIMNSNMSSAIRELKRIVKQHLKSRGGADAHSS